MSAVAIRAEGLGKQFHIGQVQRGYKTFREVAVDAFLDPLRRMRSLIRGHVSGAADLNETMWALRDVGFEIGHGDVVGIIGRNGAGKSTLLKILSRITEPTKGYVEMHGRVGALLEVGTGFHQELTGRENIYLNGAILGMRKTEIDRKFDEIVAFAEVERFLDTPVKHYSSGMQTRLGFAVAAHLDPEILLVDEVLAVGDAAFQKKCLGKMGDVAREGRTVLLVSHNMASIQHLCPRVIVLKGGEVLYAGDAQTGIAKYLDESDSSSDGQFDLRGHPARRAGCLPLLRGVRLLDGAGRQKPRFSSGDTMQIELDFDPVTSLQQPEFGIGVDDWLGSRIFSVATYLSSSHLPSLLEPCTVRCTITELPLVPGRYYLSLSAGTRQNHLMDALDSPISFEIEAGDFYSNGQMPQKLGRVLIRSEWSKTC